MTTALLSADEWNAVALSLKVGLASVVFSLPVGLGLAYALARGRFRGKGLVDAVVHLPLVLPPVVTGYLLLLAFGRSGPLGVLLQDLFGVSVAFRWTGAAIAAAVMGLPLMVRPMRLSFESIDRRLEIAARTLGAGPCRVFLTITLPLALPGIAAGAILSFARSLGEFGATITFVANIPGQTQTIPIAIHNLLQAPDGDAAAIRLCLLSIVLSLAGLMGSDFAARRMSGGRPRHEL